MLPTRNSFQLHMTLLRAAFLWRFFWTILMLTRTVGAGTGPDVEAIIKDLRKGHSLVQLFNVHHNTITLIVSPMDENGNTIDLESAYVFEQDIATLDPHYRTIKLMTPKKVKDRWPGLSGSYWRMVWFHNSGRQYIIVSDEKATYAMDVIKGTIGALPLNDIGHYEMQSYPLLSTITEHTVIHYEDGSFTNDSFLDFPQTKLLIIPDGNDVGCCQITDITLYFTMDQCPGDASKLNWLQSGFIDGQNFVLFQKDNTVVIFPRSIFDLFTGREQVNFDVNKTDAWHFWRKFEPSERPVSAIPSQASNVSHTPGSVVAFKYSQSRRIVILGLGIGTVVLIAAVAYCYVCKCFCWKDDALASSSTNDGGGKLPNKVKANSEGNSKSNKMKTSSSNLPQDGPEQIGIVMKQYQQPNTDGSSSTTMGYLKNVKTKQSRKTKGKKRSITKRGKQSSSRRSSNKGKRSSATRKG